MLRTEPEKPTAVKLKTEKQKIELSINARRVEAERLEKEIQGLKKVSARSSVREADFT